MANIKKVSNLLPWRKQHQQTVIVLGVAYKYLFPFLYRNYTVYWLSSKIWVSWPLNSKPSILGPATSGGSPFKSHLPGPIHLYTLLYSQKDTIRHFFRLPMRFPWRWEMFWSDKTFSRIFFTISRHNHKVYFFKATTLQFTAKQRDTILLTLDIAVIPYIEKFYLARLCSTFLYVVLSSFLTSTETDLGIHCITIFI